MTVGEWDLERGIAGDHAKSVIGEMQVADNFGAKHAGDVGSGGSAIARSNLFRNTTSANDVAAFEDESRIPGASEIRGSGESVVASADDDGVVNRVATAGHAADQWSNKRTTLGEETNESPLKKPLKNGLGVLYLSLTEGQEKLGGAGPWKELRAVWRSRRR
jgi:hypothetical protein